MNLVYLNPVGFLGGAERSLLNWLSAVRQAFPQANIYLIICTPGPLQEMAGRLGVDVMVLPMPQRLVELGDSQLNRNERNFQRLALLVRTFLASWEGVRYLTAMARVIRKIHPHLIHSNGIKTHLLIGLLPIGPAPVIWHIRDFLGQRRLISGFLRLATKNGVQAIANSHAVGEDFSLLFPSIPLTVIYNGIDTVEFGPAERDVGLLDNLVGTCNRTEDCIRVGLVATYNRWKGHDVFLRAIARICQQQPEHKLRFFIVGGPIYHTAGSQFLLGELQTMAQQLGISHRVHFIPFQTNVADIYRALDIVVHASTQPEPFGLTIAEAMACGKPVIISQAGGAAELFEHGISGVGVPPKDETALALAIVELAGNPAKREMLGQNARARVVSKFSQMQLAENVVKLYRTILG